MFRNLTKSISHMFGNRKSEINRVQVSEERIREMLKGERDFRITVSPNSTVDAYCKSCNETMQVAESGGLVWFTCRLCKRRSFNPIGNLQRDTQLAIQDGKPLEYELFFFKDLPPGLRSPF